MKDVWIQSTIENAKCEGLTVCTVWFASRKYFIEVCCTEKPKKAKKVAEHDCSINTNRNLSLDFNWLIIIKTLGAFSHYNASGSPSYKRHVVVVVGKLELNCKEKRGASFYRRPPRRLYDSLAGQLDYLLHSLCQGYMRKTCIWNVQGQSQSGLPNCSAKTLRSSRELRIIRKKRYLRLFKTYYIRNVSRIVLIQPLTVGTPQTTI